MLAMSEARYSEVVADDRLGPDRRCSTPRLRPLASRGRVPANTYLRRRIVAAVVLSALVLGAWGALRAVGGVGVLRSSERSLPMTPVTAGTHVVQPGETFWSIAHRLNPDGDPRPIVDRLVATNGGTQLQAGEVIVVPASAVD